jgi:hypothetical protein
MNHYCLRHACTPGHDAAVSALSQLLVRANDGKLSARAIARLAREHGHSLNHDTAARYLRGDHGRPDEATLTAFAEILAIPLVDLRAAAGLPTELTDPYQPPAEASRLTRRQRRAVDEIIRAMLTPASADEGRSEPADIATLRGRGRRSGQRAARHGDPEPPAS